MIGPYYVEGYTPKWSTYNWLRVEWSSMSLFLGLSLALLTPNKISGITINIGPGNTAIEPS